ncbi:hypothetical protein QNI16_21560 [Cytophagaceae bacterium YF14B1]|uniref:Uncharacterized protein n=1 Tax=Xanthocytophaga flava TaxID=3048013 RepID=A0AAE3QTU4_9BACT|nr:hypothetical protein [Xanthocytophaga flavus]MDJ1483100.1 hypothetical protein [Xanthocytophaga flavus]
MMVDSKLSFTREKLKPIILELAGLYGYDDPVIYLNELLERVKAFDDFSFTANFYLNIHYLCKEYSDKFWSEIHRQKITTWLKGAPILTSVFDTTWEPWEANKVNSILKDFWEIWNNEPQLKLTEMKEYTKIFKYNSTPYAIINPEEFRAVLPPVANQPEHPFNLSWNQNLVTGEPMYANPEGSFLFKFNHIADVNRRTVSERHIFPLNEVNEFLDYHYMHALESNKEELLLNTLHDMATISRNESFISDKAREVLLLWISRAHEKIASPEPLNADLWSVWNHTNPATMNKIYLRYKDHFKEREKVKGELAVFAYKLLKQGWIYLGNYEGFIGKSEIARIFITAFGVKQNKNSDHEAFPFEITHKTNELSFSGKTALLGRFKDIDLNKEPIERQHVIH